jgi:hypothetical protein
MEGHEAIARRHLADTHHRGRDSDVRPEAAVMALLEEREDGWRGLDWLARRFDLSRISSGLVDRLELAPQLYYPDANGPNFEFQRTPNIFPTGRLVFAAAGGSALSAAAGFGGIVGMGGGPFELAPDGGLREWKLLGGLISSSAAGSVLVQDHNGRRTFAGVTFGAAGAQQFTIPGNGARVRAGIGRSFQLFSSAIANIDFVFWVAGELERKA